MYEDNPYLFLIESEIIENEPPIHTVILEEYEKVVAFKKEQTDSELKYNYYDKYTDEFGQLKEAFDQWKKSNYVMEITGIRFRDIKKAKQDVDFEHVDYNIQPYGLGFSICRFYFFPSSIWVFTDKKGLIGIYKKEAIDCELITEEKTSDNTVAIFPDTTVLTIQKETWKHTCLDGTPDYRYNNNPKIKNVTYIKCLIFLEICGFKLKFRVSSVKNCITLQSAVLSYSQKKS